MQPENPGEGSMPVQTDAGGRRPWRGEPGAAEPPEPTPQADRSRLRSGLTVAAVVLGLAGLAASAAGIAVQVLPRRFSAAQQQQIMAWESARRWRASPAGRIFPAIVSYQLPSFALSGPAGLSLRARRVGIAGRVNCAAGADPAAAAVLSRHGCAAMLRATYIDATGSLVVTIGVAVMPDTAATAASIRALPSRHGVRSGVRPLAFGNTLTAGFGSAQRQLSYAVAAGPYLILSVAGYADGRPRVRVSSDAYAQGEMASLANGVADAVSVPLGALPSPPTCPGAPGC
jgi:hypothetical protein